MDKIKKTEITPEDTIRMITAFLTAFKKSWRTGIATQIYNALFTIGYRLRDTTPSPDREAVLDQLHWKSFTFFGQDHAIIEGMLTQESEEAIADAILKLQPVLSEGKPKVVCLCGSTRFEDAFMTEYARLSDAGIIVLSVSRLIPDHRDKQDWEFPEQENVWHELHFKKIDLADEVFVLNVGGYIGNSLKEEIAYAIAKGKAIKYLVNPA